MEYEKKIAGDGTKLSGFVSDEENVPPRECHNCVFYKHDLCHHPIVMIDPEVPGEHGKPKPVGDGFCCNFFRSPGRTLIYAVRHGEDEGDHLIGGWEDEPIDDKGKNDAKEAAEKLKGKGIRYIVASDMKRTVETAKIIADILEIKHFQTDFRLRTWNKGIYNGQEKTEENKADLTEYKENPSWVIPKGESHYQFEDRMVEAFDDYTKYAMEDGIYLLLLHNSGVKELQRYCAGEPVTDESPDSVLPGGIAKVTTKKGKLSCEVVFKDKPGSGHKS